MLNAPNSSKQFEPGGPSFSLLTLHQEMSNFLKALCIRSQTGLISAQHRRHVEGLRTGDGFDQNCSF